MARTPSGLQIGERRWEQTVRWPTVTPLVCSFLRFASFVLVLAASSRTARAEVAKTAASSAAPERAEEEAADSPRASIRAFLDLSERGRYTEAAVYLDVPKGREKRAPELASKLHTVLSERLLVDPEQLSPLAHGKPTDGLPPGIEELGKINDSKGHPVSIRLVRHESKALDDETRWVFSSSTVAQVDQLYGALRARWMREHLPESLLIQGPMALYYWQWLAIPLLAVLCIALGRALSWMSGVITKRILSQRKWGADLLEKLKYPASLGWALAVFALSTPFLALTLRAEDLVERIVRAFAYLAFFWALLRTVVVFGNELAHGEWARSRPSARSLSSVGMSLSKVVVAALALMVALSELGYPVTSVIAGLGLGGVALALAAQKTVENLFGSISILADQPFRIGDTIRVDSIEGTVESIGLRSTRVRTADRSLVIMPNGKLADTRIESLGSRDRMRFVTKLPLSRTSTKDQVRRLVDATKARLTEHPNVRKEDVFVRLAAIGETSFDIEVTAPVDTTDAGEFGRIREELLLACIETVEASGTTLAIPTRQLLGPAPGPPDGPVSRPRP